MRINFTPEFEIKDESLNMTGLFINGWSFENMVSNLIPPTTGYILDIGNYRGYGHYVCSTDDVPDNANVFPDANKGEIIGSVSVIYNEVFTTLYSHLYDNEYDGTLISYDSIYNIFRFIDGGDPFIDDLGDLEFSVTNDIPTNDTWIKMFHFVLFYFGEISNGQLIIDFRGIHDYIDNDNLSDVVFSLKGKFNNLGILREYGILDIFNKDNDFYARVFGRDISLPSETWADSQSRNNRKFPLIARHLLTEELGFESSFSIADLDEYLDLWLNDFTVNERINAKKLIEGIASTTPYIPHFDSLGNFKIDVIPIDGGINKIVETIKEIDVIDFSFSRTRIEDVKTKIEVKYKWDYSLGEFVKALSPVVIEDLFASYDPKYYGLKETIAGDSLQYVVTDHIDTTLVIDDDRGKYIRDGDTARSFAYWMLSWYCNQHVKIKVKLPLRYLSLEVADIIDFDSILGGVKPYGVDYTKQGETLNGQVIYPSFMITSLNKTLEFVEIECIQMHGLYLTNCDTGYDCAGICCDNDTPLCNEGVDGTGNDECGVCGGNGSSCDECSEVYPSTPCGTLEGGCFSMIDGACGCPEIDDDGNPIYTSSQQCDSVGGIWANANCYPVMGCDGNCGYDGLTYDECGVCGGEGAIYQCGCYDIPEGECDCDGNILDLCGECGGDPDLCNECSEIYEDALCGDATNPETGEIDGTGCRQFGICGNCIDADDVYLCPEPGHGLYYDYAYHFPVDVNKVKFAGTELHPQEGNNDIFIEEQHHMFSGYNVGQVPSYRAEGLELYINWSELENLASTMAGNPLYGYTLPSGLILEWIIANVSEEEGLNGAGSLYVNDIKIQMFAQNSSDEIYQVDFYEYNSFIELQAGALVETGTHTSATIKEDGDLFFKIAWEEEFIEMLDSPSRDEDEDQQIEDKTFDLRIKIEYKVIADFEISESDLNYWFINNDGGYTFKRFLDIPVKIIFGTSSGGSDTEDQTCEEQGLFECEDGICADTEANCPQSECASTGDANGDGFSDVLDIVQMVNHILGNSTLVGEPFEEADTDCSNSVDVIDIVNVVNMIIG